MDIRFHIVTSQLLNCGEEETRSETETVFHSEEADGPETQPDPEEPDDDYQDDLDDLFSQREDFMEALDEYIEQLSGFNASYPNQRVLLTVREEQLLLHMKGLLDSLNETEEDGEEDCEEEE